MSPFDGCHRGGQLEPCARCGHPRCLHCDPYVCDDCRYVGRP